MQIRPAASLRPQILMSSSSTLHVGGGVGRKSSPGKTRTDVDSANGSHTVRLPALVCRHAHITLEVLGVGCIEPRRRAGRALCLCRWIAIIKTSAPCLIRVGNVPRSKKSRFKRASLRRVHYAKRCETTVLHSAGSVKVARNLNCRAPRIIRSKQCLPHLKSTCMSHSTEDVPAILPHSWCAWACRPESQAVTTLLLYAK